MPNIKKLRLTLNELLEDLKNVLVYKDEIEDLNTIETLLNFLPDEILLSNMQSSLFPYKKQICSKDDKYFISNCSDIFKGLPSDRVQHFSKVLQDPKRIDKETRLVIFDYLIVMIKMCEK